MKLLKFYQVPKKAQISLQVPVSGKVAELSLFLLGTGQVATALLQQIAERDADSGIKLTVLGIANSRKMLFDAQGIDPAHWSSRLAEEGKPAHLSFFLKRLRRKGLSSPVFIDCTASEQVPEEYAALLRAGISIVTPNKRGNAGRLSRYEQLKSEASNPNVRFLYETNVGAGLPIISTLQDLLASGDEITRIEAVLSGTLSYVFNSFGHGRSFSEVIFDAKQKGYTEPDPREDLSGQDVARKLLILAREMGLPLELEDLDIQSLVPNSCAHASSVEEFFTLLKKEDGYFEKLRADAEASGQVLRYIGKIEGGKVSIRLEAVSSTHPFFALAARDNIVSFSSKRYAERPLVVQGPGAGTDVTAAGILADILRIGR